MTSDLELVPGLVVSRETAERLSIYEAVLRTWQTKINLVANSTIKDVWARHFADSLQILRFRSDAKSCVDMGSGAGFPGLVIAIHLCSEPEALVHLIESDGKKCAFLREVIRETGARAIVHNKRIESIVGDLSADLVVARALAPISKLLDLANPLLMKGAMGIFLKGQEVAAELTAVRASSNLNIQIRPSLTDTSGHIVLVNRLQNAGKHEDSTTCKQIHE